MLDPTQHRSDIGPQLYLGFTGVGLGAPMELTLLWLYKGYN